MRSTVQSSLQDRLSSITRSETPFCPGFWHAPGLHPTFSQLGLPEFDRLSTSNPVGRQHRAQLRAEASGVSWTRRTALNAATAAVDILSLAAFATVLFLRAYLCQRRN